MSTQYQPVSDLSHRAKGVGMTAAFTGAPLFLIGTILHPARDGQGVAAAGDVYGVTHSIQAVGLFLLENRHAALLASAAHPAARQKPLAWLAALAGTLAWFGLIVFDGSHNPATAMHAPELVHSHAGLSLGAAIIVLPALLLFPLGYVLFARALLSQGLPWAGALLGVGAVLYTIGGLLIFILGPQSPLIQILEVVGAVPFALGFILMARAVR
jgi:hypothetical protein